MNVLMLVAGFDNKEHLRWKIFLLCGVRVSIINKPEVIGNYSPARVVNFLVFNYVVENSVFYNSVVVRTVQLKLYMQFLRVERLQENKENDVFKGVKGWLQLRRTMGYVKEKL